MTEEQFPHFVKPWAERCALCRAWADWMVGDEPRCDEHAPEVPSSERTWWAGRMETKTKLRQWQASYEANGRRPRVVRRARRY